MRSNDAFWFWFLDAFDATIQSLESTVFFLPSQRFRPVCCDFVFAFSGEDQALNFSEYYIACKCHDKKVKKGIREWEARL